MPGPLVSIVTPVYNGGPYLRQCIESVLAQTYREWDYTVVNNCSTDDSLAIAQEYASRDARIRVHSNARHVRVAENCNNAVRAISRHSKYCKVLLADDWMFPRCLESMIELAEAHPTVGVVGAYVLFGDRVTYDGLPYPSTVVPGHRICRSTLLGDLYVFGSATSTMLRADVVHSRDPFYNESSVHCDMEVCYQALQEWDFGFVHEVLTFSRTDNESIHKITDALNTRLVADIYHVLKYGPAFLTDMECQRRLDELWKRYYRFLGRAVFARRGPEFWRFHERKLRDLVQPLKKAKIGLAMTALAIDAALNPKRSLEKAWKLVFARKVGAEAIAEHAQGGQGANAFRMRNALPAGWLQGGLLRRKGSWAGGPQQEADAQRGG